jgi:hypothetical protein
MGGAIIFVCAFVACTICSMLYLVFASHYFLVTVIDSSAGHDEVQYPSESVIDWWWKPLFCLWILAFWVVTLAILLTPLLALGPKAYGICLGLLIWFFYPLGVLSALYTSNWLFFLHPILLWRMLKHYTAFAYVHLVTLLAASAGAGLLLGAFTHSFLWSLAAAVVVPGAILFYARQWGRFAWLSLNFAPRAKKRPRTESTQAANKKTTAGNSDEDAPEMAVEEVDEAAEGMRAGLPPAYPHGIQMNTPGSPAGTGAEAAPADGEEEDEFAPNKKPYKIVGDPTWPISQETAAEPVSVATSPPPPSPQVEEEDEWATDKKPYAVIAESADGGSPGAAPAESAPAQSEANTPISVSKYYEERHKKEKAAKAKAKEIAQQQFMPPPSKKTPTFATALFLGVFEFMLYGKTLQVWATLAAFTIAELVLLSMVAQFWPRLDQ